MGNWVDELLLAGERFDTVLMDYFIGAVEGLRYWQERAFDRVRPHVTGHCISSAWNLTCLSQPIPRPAG